MVANTSTVCTYVAAGPAIGYRLAHMLASPLLYLICGSSADFYVLVGQLEPGDDWGQERAAADIMQMRVGRTVVPVDVEYVAVWILVAPIEIAGVVVAVFAGAHRSILRPVGTESPAFALHEEPDSGVKPSFHPANRVDRGLFSKPLLRTDFGQHQRRFVVRKQAVEHTGWPVHERCALSFTQDTGIA